MTSIYYPLSYLNLAELYLAAPYFWDSIIFLMLFLGISTFVFKKKFEKSGKAVSVAISLALTVSLALWEFRTGWYIGRAELAILPLIIIFSLVTFLLYRLFSELFEMPIACAFSLAFLMTAPSMEMMFNRIWGSLMAATPIFGTFITLLIGVSTAITIWCIIRAISNFKKEGGGDGGDDDNRETPTAAGDPWNRNRDTDRRGNNTPPPRAENVSIKIRSPATDGDSYNEGQNVPVMIEITGNQGDFVVVVYVQNRNSGELFYPLHQTDSSPINFDITPEMIDLHDNHIEPLAPGENKIKVEFQYTSGGDPVIATRTFIYGAATPPGTGTIEGHVYIGPERGENAEFANGAHVYLAEINEGRDPRPIAGPRITKEDGHFKFDGVPLSTPEDPRKLTVVGGYDNGEREHLTRMSKIDGEEKDHIILTLENREIKNVECQINFDELKATITAPKDNDEQFPPEREITVSAMFSSPTKLTKNPVWVLMDEDKKPYNDPAHQLTPTARAPDNSSESVVVPPLNPGTYYVKVIIEHDGNHDDDIKRFIVPAVHELHTGTITGHVYLGDPGSDNPTFATGATVYVNDVSNPHSPIRIGSGIAKGPEAFFRIDNLPKKVPLFVKASFVTETSDRPLSGIMVDPKDNIVLRDDSPSREATVRVDSELTLDFFKPTSEGPFEINTPVEIMALANGGTPKYNFKWYFKEPSGDFKPVHSNDAANSFGPSRINLGVKAPGIYSVKVEVTDGIGDSLSKEMNLQFGEAETPKTGTIYGRAVITTNPTAPMKGEDFEFVMMDSKTNEALLIPGTDKRFPFAEINKRDEGDFFVFKNVPFDTDIYIAGRHKASNNRGDQDKQTVPINLNASKTNSGLIKVYFGGPALASGKTPESLPSGLDKDPADASPEEPAPSGDKKKDPRSKSDVEFTENDLIITPDASYNVQQKRKFLYGFTEGHHLFGGNINPFIFQVRTAKRVPGYYRYHLSIWRINAQGERRLLNKAEVKKLGIMITGGKTLSGKGSEDSMINIKTYPVDDGLVVEDQEMVAGESEPINTATKPKNIKVHFGANKQLENVSGFDALDDGPVDSFLISCTVYLSRTKKGSNMYIDAGGNWIGRTAFIEVWNPESPELVKIMRERLKLNKYPGVDNLDDDQVKFIDRWIKQQEKGEQVSNNE